MAVFQKFKSLNMKYSRWAPKGIILLRTTFIGVFWRKNPFRSIGCRLFKRPKNEEKASALTPEARQNHVGLFAEQKPLN